MKVRVHFACCECGQTMGGLPPGRRPDPPFCLACLNVPGWFRSLPLRLRFSPTHSGAEPLLATVPEWEPTS